jgi:hypothetical protein
MSRRVALVKRVQDTGGKTAGATRVSSPELNIQKLKPLAFQPALPRLLAVKVLAPGLPLDAPRLSRAVR